MVLPTGTGKSLCLAKIASDAVTLWGCRVLILAHVRELLEQNADKVRRLCPELRVGVYSAGLNSRDTRESVIVAGIQSVYNKACDLGMSRAGPPVAAGVPRGTRRGRPFVRPHEGGRIRPGRTGLRDGRRAAGGRLLLRDRHTDEGKEVRPNLLHFRGTMQTRGRGHHKTFRQGVRRGHRRDPGRATRRNHRPLPRRARPRRPIRNTKAAAQVPCDSSVLTTGFDAPNTDFVVLMRPTHLFSAIRPPKQQTLIFGLWSRHKHLMLWGYLDHDLFSTPYLGSLYESAYMPFVSSCPVFMPNGLLGSPMRSHRLPKTSSGPMT